MSNVWAVAETEAELLELITQARLGMLLREAEPILVVCDPIAEAYIIRTEPGFDRWPMSRLVLPMPPRVVLTTGIRKTPTWPAADAVHIVHKLTL